LGSTRTPSKPNVVFREFLKFSTSTRTAFVAGRMVERQHQRRQDVRQDMKPLFKTLLKRGERHGDDQGQGAVTLIRAMGQYNKRKHIKTGARTPSTHSNQRLLETNKSTRGFLKGRRSFRE
jgi:hypothetical protein